jgi:hypothetical protein
MILNQQQCQTLCNKFDKKHNLYLGLISEEVEFIESCLFDEIKDAKVRDIFYSLSYTYEKMTGICYLESHPMFKFSLALSLAHHYRSKLEVMESYYD